MNTNTVRLHPIKAVVLVVLALGLLLGSKACEPPDHVPGGRPGFPRAAIIQHARTTLDGPISITKSDAEESPDVRFPS